MQLQRMCVYLEVLLGAQEGNEENMFGEVEQQTFMKNGDRVHICRTNTRPVASAVSMS